MIDSLYARLAGAALIVALLGGAYAWVHHRGAVSQQVEDATTIGHLRDALASASNQLRIDASTFRQLNANAAREAANAADQQRVGAAAVKAAEADAKQAAADASAWHRKFTRAAKSKDCATLMEQQICAAVFEH